VEVPSSDSSRTEKGGQPHGWLTRVKTDGPLLTLLLASHVSTSTSGLDLPERKGEVIAFEQAGDCLSLSLSVSFSFFG
jgi:hypothetical protein